MASPSSLASSGSGVTLLSLPGIIFMLLSLMALLAGAVAIIRSQYVKTRLDLAEAAVLGLRGDRDDLQARLDEARKENADCATKHQVLSSQLAAEVVKREALEKIVTGKREIAEVRKLLETHEERAQRIETMVQDLHRRPRAHGGVV